MKGKLLQADNPAAKCRIVQGYPSTANVDQDHKVIHIPVQYAGPFHLVNLIQAQG